MAHMQHSSVHYYYTQLFIHVVVVVVDVDDGISRTKHFRRIDLIAVHPQEEIGRLKRNLTLIPTRSIRFGQTTILVSATSRLVTWIVHNGLDVLWNLRIIRYIYIYIYEQRKRQNRVCESE
jgi:hypothetical protein